MLLTGPRHERLVGLETLDRGLRRPPAQRVDERQHPLGIDRLRRRRPSAAIEDVPEPVDPEPSVLMRMAQTETSRAVAAAIAELPERQRQAIVLRHFEAWSNPEIGEALGCSVEAVESLLARGRRTLAQKLNNVEQE